MFDALLAQAVRRFANTVVDMPDVELDRAWAWGAYDGEGIRFAFFRTYEELRELGAKTGTERSAVGPPRTTAQRILAQYHVAYRELQAGLLGIGSAEADLAPALGEWPIRDIMAHIVGADVGFYGVVRYALDRYRADDDRPAEISADSWAAMIGLDEGAFTKLMDERLPELQSYHKEFHDRVLTEFADISEAELAVPSLYWEGYELSLRFRLHRFDSHMRQHTVQLDKTLPSIGLAQTEAKRLLRLIYSALGDAEGAVIGAWDMASDLGAELANEINARTAEIAAALS
jgi:hypothetical protein